MEPLTKCGTMYTNWAVQSQKMASDMKFTIKEGGELHLDDKSNGSLSMSLADFG